jgi:hypothetical protein
MESRPKQAHYFQPDPLRVSRLAETDKAISAKAANALHPKDLGSA